MNQRDEAVGRAAAAQLPGLPRNEDGPVFGEPWQAAAFALAVSLSQRGHFSWKEWAAALAEELKMSAARGEPDDGSHYYHCWLATLERLIVSKGLSRSEDLIPDLLLFALRRSAISRHLSSKPSGPPTAKASCVRATLSDAPTV